MEWVVYLMEWSIIKPVCSDILVWICHTRRCMSWDWRKFAWVREGVHKVKQDELWKSLKMSLDFLRTTDKRFYHQTIEQLFEEYEQIIHQHIDLMLPNFFSNIPDMVTAMPFHGSGGMYVSTTDDDSSLGVFYANLDLPEIIPRFCMMDLSPYDACPGHHFQHSIAIKESLLHFHKELNYRQIYAAPFQYPIHSLCRRLGIILWRTWHRHAIELSTFRYYTIPAFMALYWGELLTSPRCQKVVSYRCVVQSICYRINECHVCVSACQAKAAGEFTFGTISVIRVIRLLVGSIKPCRKLFFHSKHCICQKKVVII